MNVSLLSNLRNNRIGCKRTSNKVDLLRIIPSTSSLRARKYSNLPKCRFLAPVQTLGACIGTYLYTPQRVGKVTFNGCVP